ncbi:MAG: hypothetical protein PUP92_09730 [Rhizonema sp. PD38]|nr:hypothetical protein [Rhizonema sp. PD38]
MNTNSIGDVESEVQGKCLVFYRSDGVDDRYCRLLLYFLQQQFS